MVKIVEAATNGKYKIGIGFTPDNTPVVVAITPSGEGYTPYPSLMAAGRVYDEIVASMKMEVLQ